MAVKHKVVDFDEHPLNNNGNNNSHQQQHNLLVMLRVLEQLRNEPETMPQGADLIRLCQAIVSGLGNLVVPREPSAIATFVQNVHSIQEFLSTVCLSGGEQLVFATLKTLYENISDPKAKPGAAMSVVLQLVDVNYLPNAVNLILDAGYNEMNLEQALHTLCTWLTYWTKTPNLSECVLVFMSGLEAQKHFGVLVNVTLNVIENLFNRLKLPAYRSAIEPIIIRMLSRMQSNPEAFHCILPHVEHVIVCLKQEKSSDSAVCLQEIINLCKALRDNFPDYTSLYEKLDNIFTIFPPDDDCTTYLQCTPWTDPDLLLKRRTPNEKVGLNNLGNTCYMNSVLQALFMTRLFSNYVLMQEHRWPMLSKLQSLFAQLQFSLRTSLSPDEVLHMVRPSGFHPGHQHDSSEFLGYLLDILHEQEKSISTVRIDGEIENAIEPAVSTLVQRAFGGRAETVYRCDGCGTASTRADNFRELQLSFPSDFNEGDSVQTLLDYCLKPERLCDDNKYHCEQCDGLSDAVREFRVIQPPPRLVLTLKHFQYISASQQRTKLLHRVHYDNSLHLAGAVYELYAAIIHCGGSVDSGHYYTYARDVHGWYKFNDCHVTACTSGMDLSSLRPPETPYILFYSRQDCVEPDPIQRNTLPLSVDAFLKREAIDLETERRNRQHRVESNYSHYIDKTDDPPPPGCGGGGSMPTAGRFVC